MLKKVVIKTKEICEYVFANPITQTRYYDIKKSFLSICNLAQVEDFRFHDLRHTFATRMVNSGVDLILVKNILGHSDIRTTVRYAHAVTEQSLEAIESVSNYAEKNKKIVKLQVNH